MSSRQLKRRGSRRKRHSERSSASCRLVAAGGLTAGATLAISGVAQAAPQTYTVGTNANTSTGGACTTATNNDCSLREAVNLANANAGADTIVFNSNLTGSTINLTTGQLLVTEALTINGPGASQLTVDGGGTQRLFDVDPTTADDPVSISGLRLADGDAGTGNGGAVYNYDGSLTINSSTVSGNHAYAGGGIATKYGALAVVNSTVSGNFADGNTGANGDSGYGGGIYANDDATVTNSTINNNVGAYDGGGIYSAHGNGTLTVQNSTIANNQALHDDGGGIWSETENGLTVRDSTITGNSAQTKTGGIQDYSVGGVIQNSIVSGNTAYGTPSTSDLDSHDYQFDTAFSLIGRPEAYINNTVVGSNLFGVDPQLGPLTNNGGPTLTFLPANTSPVVDKGKAFGLSTDQRGLTRPVEIPSIPNSSAPGADGSDIGAVELQSVPFTPAKPKCKKKKHKKHKRSAQSSKKKKCKKKHKKHKK